jgi:alkylation response protein AidB-like acyl-CoA dehydrogenase
MIQDGAAVDLAQSDAQRSFRDELRAFLDAALAVEISNDFEGQRAWQRALHAGRWVAPHWPARYGGRDASIEQFAIFIEELARARAPQLANRVGLQTAGPVLLAHGSDEQRERYLPRIASADDIWCQLYSEPGAGSDLTNLSTTARLDGEVWRVNGQKVWTSFGAESDFGLLLARSEPAAAPSRGISCFVCDMHAPGVEVRPLRTMTGESEFAEVFLDDVVLPPDALIGERGSGWEVGNTGLASERGVAFPLKEQAALQILLDELLDRVRSDRIAPSPIQRDRIGQDIVNLHVLRLMNLKTVSQLSAGAELGTWASLIKLTWEETAQHLGDTLFETTGPSDAIDEDGRAAAMLRYRMASIAGGTSQIQRNILSERRLGLPREPRRA